MTIERFEKVRTMLPVCSVYSVAESTVYSVAESTVYSVVESTVYSVASGPRSA